MHLLGPRIINDDGRPSPRRRWARAAILAALTSATVGGCFDAGDVEATAADTGSSGSSSEGNATGDTTGSASPVDSASSSTTDVGLDDTTTSNSVDETSGESDSTDGGCQPGVFGVSAFGQACFQ